MVSRYGPVPSEAGWKEKNALRRKDNRNFIRFIGAVILAAAGLIFFRRMFLFILFIVITAVITYYTKLYHFPFDISPLFFLEIVITRYYGLHYTLIFILVGYFIPKLIAGSGANWMSYAFIGVSLLANVASLTMLGLPLQTVGYLTSVIQYIGGVFITLTMKPLVFALADGLANTTNNLIYFLIFSDLIVLVLGH